VDVAVVDGGTQLFTETQAETDEHMLITDDETLFMVSNGDVFGIATPIPRR
jgi:hypothetical protein